MRDFLRLLAIGVIAWIVSVTGFLLGMYPQSEITENATLFMVIWALATAYEAKDGNRHD